MALSPDETSNTIQPEPVVERIVHAPIKPDAPAPGADAKSPEPVATDETAEAPAAETTEPSEEQKQSRFQRRLDRQKAARYQAEAQANALREERDRLRARLDGQHARPQQEQPTGNTGQPTRDQFGDYEEFLRADARWTAAQETQAQLKAEREAAHKQWQEQQAAVQHKKIADSWIEHEKAIKATAKDYDEKANEFLDEDANRLSTEARELIMESEVGPNLLYHLAVNPDEVERIAELSPRRQLIELGKLEDKLPKSNGKKTTNAPPPASTVRQGANSADGLRENMTQAEVASYMRSHGSRWVR